MNCPQQAHGQISQANKAAPSSQYAPGDPWTRSKLFRVQTKHYGFGYNCDDEECKRNSPYICWKHQADHDLPARKGWWQRLSQTAAEVKQRIADGNCVKCAEADPCLRCQQQKCGGCCDCSRLTGLEIATSNTDKIKPPHPEFVVPRPPLEASDFASSETWQPTDKAKSLLSRLNSPQQTSAPAHVAGLEGLDIRVE